MSATYQGSEKLSSELIEVINHSIVPVSPIALVLVSGSTYRLYDGLGRVSQQTPLQLREQGGRRLSRDRRANLAPADCPTPSQLVPPDSGLRPELSVMASPTLRVSGGARDGRVLLSSEYTLGAFDALGNLPLTVSEYPAAVGEVRATEDATGLEVVLPSDRWSYSAGALALIRWPETVSPVAQGWPSTPNPDPVLSGSYAGASIGTPRAANLDPLPGAIATDAMAAGAVSSPFSVTGCVPVEPWPGSWAMAASGLDSTYGSLPYSVWFRHSGSALDLRFLDSGPVGWCRIWADGVLVGTTPGTTGDGQERLIRVTFPTASTRQIQVEWHYHKFCGVVALAGTLSPASAPTARAIFLGDSFTEGIGPADGNGLDGYAHAAAHLLGWRDIWASGSGGTGYLNPGQNGRKTFRQRVHTDVIAHNPSLVIVAGGINDQPYTPADIQVEAAATFDAVMSSLPSTELIVVGPWWPNGTPTAAILAIRDAIKNAAQARNLRFIDPIGEGWVTGTGRAGNVKGDGNADWVTSSDGTHPTTEGHHYLAQRLAVAMARGYDRATGVLVTRPLPAGVSLRNGASGPYFQRASDTTFQLPAEFPRPGTRVTADGVECSGSGGSYTVPPLNTGQLVWADAPEGCTLRSDGPRAYTMVVPAASPDALGSWRALSWTADASTGKGMWQPSAQPIIDGAMYKATLDIELLEPGPLPAYGPTGIRFWLSGENVDPSRFGTCEIVPDPSNPLKARYQVQGAWVTKSTGKIGWYRADTTIRLKSARWQCEVQEPAPVVFYCHIPGGYSGPDYVQAGSDVTLQHAIDSAPEAVWAAGT